MPVTEDNKPKDNLGEFTSYKQKYSSMKDKLKAILYENELFEDELRKLQRELLDIYRDKQTLLGRIIQYEDIGSASSDSELSQLSDNDCEIETQPTTVVVAVQQTVKNNNNNNNNNINNDGNKQKTTPVNNKRRNTSTSLNVKNNNNNINNNNNDGNKQKTTPVNNKRRNTSTSLNVIAAKRNNNGKNASNNNGCAKPTIAKPPKQTTAAPRQRQPPKSKSQPKAQPKTQQPQAKSQPQAQQQPLIQIQAPQQVPTQIQLPPQTQSQLQLQQQQRPVTVLGRVPISNNQINLIQQVSPIVTTMSTGMVPTIQTIASQPNHSLNDPYQSHQMIQQQQHHHIHHHQAQHLSGAQMIQMHHQQPQPYHISDPQTNGTLGMENLQQVQHQQQIMTSNQSYVQQHQVYTEQLSAEELEQHLEIRRMEQAALLLSDLESSVPGEIFNTDAAIKFMAED